jgi:hypothetical protein
MEARQRRLLTPRKLFTVQFYALFIDPQERQMVVLDLCLEEAREFGNSGNED